MPSNFIIDLIGSTLNTIHLQINQFNRLLRVFCVCQINVFYEFLVNFEMRMNRVQVIRLGQYHLLMWLVVFQDHSKSLAILDLNFNEFIVFNFKFSCSMAVVLQSNCFEDFI